MNPQSLPYVRLHHVSRKTAVGAKWTLGKIPAPSSLDGLAHGRRGSALKYDLAANYRHVALDVLDLIFRHGHVIRRENRQVSQLSWLKRALSSFLNVYRSGQ